MERILQYMDDLDDLYGMVGLMLERLRRFAIYCLSLTAMLAICSAGIVLAQLHAPLALATLTILSVTLLYRAITSATPSLANTT